MTWYFNENHREGAFRSPLFTLQVTQARKRNDLSLSRNVLESVYNPCTLVPTDFQLYRKMKHKFYFRFGNEIVSRFQIGLPFSFFIFSPPGEETEFEFSLYSPFFFIVTFEKTDFNFLFSFSCVIWKTDYKSFFVFGQWQWNWQSLFRREYLGTKMAALENLIDKDFVRRFLMKQKHTYEELVTKIKTRYPNLKGCTLGSVKRLCNH